MTTRIPPAKRSMRKAPQQSRSLTMVDNILEAAARILMSRGWAKFTTNEVARLAGVSVGSLYQYFPNKLALAEAIRQKHLAAVLAALSNATKAGHATTAQQAVEQLIDGIMAAHVINPALHRILLDEVPAVQRTDDDPFEIAYQRYYASFVSSVAPQGNDDDTNTAGRVLAATVEAVVHMAARQGKLSSGLLKNELQHLVLGYLHQRSLARENKRLNISRAAQQQT